MLATLYITLLYIFKEGGYYNQAYVLSSITLDLCEGGDHLFMEVDMTLFT